MNHADILRQKREQKVETKYKKFGLSHNPFPKSGTANINESSETTDSLVPIDPDVLDGIANYVGDSLYSNDESEDYKLIGTITGDYGTGKTQLLLFAKSLILNEPKKAYVIYINNPGTKLSQLIGSIIENIGQEQFKKYLWNQIIETIKTTEDYKKKLEFYINHTGLFANKNPFASESEANHRLFLDAFLSQINDKRKVREFNDTLRNIIIEILSKKNDDDSVIAKYFYDLISEDFGISKSWEALISGDGNYLDNKVVKLLNAIITIVKEQGFERFYLLVDEFEDITSGRLTKKEQDNYTHNLRTLIDKERRWCLLIAMTSTALDDIATLSPPLYDRLTDRKISIKRLSNEQAFGLISNYLSLAREDKTDGLAPFEKNGIDYINSIAGELPRLFLRYAYYVLERAVDELNEGEIISLEFIKKHIGS
jgi:KaiC/GvpD/RAD55 family RecA-like ATPase